MTRWQSALAYLGNFLIYSEAPRPADLILVLGGDFYGSRVLKAAEMATLGYARRVLISGPPYRGRPEGEFAIAFLAKQGYRTDLFESYGHHARSTIEEAIVLRPELERRGVKRVILVTSPYHSRRAWLVFQLICSHIQFISAPGPDASYYPDRWWTDDASRHTFYSEWIKIVGAVLLAYPELMLNKLTKEVPGFLQGPPGLLPSQAPIGGLVWWSETPSRDKQAGHNNIARRACIIK